MPRPLRGVLLQEPGGEGAAAGRGATEEELRASYQRGRDDAEKAMSQQLLQQRAEVHELMRGVLESLRQTRCRRYCARPRTR